MGKHYGQLSIEELTMIQTQLAIGIKPAAIALGLNRSASTLSRELRRNGWVGPRARRGPGRPPVAGGYRVGEFPGQLVVGLREGGAGEDCPGDADHGAQGRP